MGRKKMGDNKNFDGKIKICWNCSAVLGKIGTKFEKEYCHVCDERNVEPNTKPRLILPNQNRCVICHRLWRNNPLKCSTLPDSRGGSVFVPCPALPERFWGHDIQPIGEVTSGQTGLTLPVLEQFPMEIAGSEPVRPDIERFKDEFGDIRVRYLWWNDNDCKLNLNDPGDVAQAIECYRQWVQHDDNVVIRKTAELNGKTEREWFTVKAMKRGNDIYNYNVKQRLASLEDNLKKYINPDGLHTSLIYVTLTCDPKIFDGDINKAWGEIGKNWNRFLSNVKKEYGDVVIFRGWESFENGYPHIHAVMGFDAHRFIIIPHENDAEKRGEGKTYRIPYNDKERMAGFWHSFIDVVAVTQNNLKHTIHDVCQYVIKFSKTDDYQNFDCWTMKRKKTLSFVWLFSLRTFAVSRRLLKEGMPCDDQGDLIREVVVIQTATDLHGNRATVIYEFLGMISGKKAGISADVWHKTYNKEPKWLRDVWVPSAIRSGGYVGALGEAFA